MLTIWSWHRKTRIFWKIFYVYFTTVSYHPPINLVNHVVLFSALPLPLKEK